MVFAQTFVGLLVWRILDVIVINLYCGRVTKQLLK